MSVDKTKHQSEGSVAQMVEHSLCMRGAGGSIPPTSIVLFVFSYLEWDALLSTHHHQGESVKWKNGRNRTESGEAVALISY